jgi:plasmid stabilization system protein ParE
MNIIVSQAAQADLVRLHAFLKENNRAAADRAVTALISAFQSLNTLPARGRRVGGSNMRELVAPFGRSFYVLRYAHNPRKDEVVVIRIWHGREARD